MSDAPLDHTALRALVAEGAYARLAETLAGLHPADAADFIQSLDPAAMRNAFGALDSQVAAAILLEVDEPFQEQLVELEADEPQLLASLVDEMETDDAADVLEIIEEQSEGLARDVLDRMDDEMEAGVRRLRQFPPESAGGLMHPEFFSIHERHTAGEVLHAVRAFGARHETRDLIHNVFVVDEQRRFVGTVDLYEVVLARPEARLGDLIDRDAPFAPGFLDQEEVAQLFKRHDVVSLPVTDLDGHIIGRITSDDVLDVIEQEATEDMYLLAGLDEEAHIFDTPRAALRKRLPWLGVNLVTSLAGVTVLSFFEGTLQDWVVLAVFMPIVAGLGGNAGIQTLTIMVRGLALGEVQTHSARRAIVNELLVGLCKGLVAGVFMAGVAWVWKGSGLLSLALLIAMIANVTVATVAGTVVPLTLKRFRNDPAVASSIFITAFTDAFGFFAFLGVATLLLKYLR